MELGKRIKNLRKTLNWNQDELAEKMFVSRQTISSWENDKSYPDIQSLLLLSNLFDVSLDQLVKGDVEKMKKIINEDDVKNLKFYWKMELVLVLIFAVSFGPLFLLIGLWSLIPALVIAALLMYFATKANQISKYNDISTYKEIVTFLNGKTLDEASKQQEIGKRPYQTAIVTICSGLIAGTISLAVVFVTKRYFGM